ncbi:MAG: trypsin-like peptidase domain-containing protein [Pyrinomonadaceae bacterium]
MPRILLRRTVHFTAIFFALFSVSVFAQQGSVPPSFSEIAEKAEPFVVSIEARGRVVVNAPSAGNNAPDTEDSILDFLRRQAPQRPVFHVGSGFIVDRSGYIVTNNHVVTESSRLTVKLDTGEEFTAKVVGVDDETDLAVLKIDAGRELPTARFGDSDKMKVGDWCSRSARRSALQRVCAASFRRRNATRPVHRHFSVSFKLTQSSIRETQAARSSICRARSLA